MTVVYIKGNDLPLQTELSLDVLYDLHHLLTRGAISVSVSVVFGERVGYIPLEDLDFTRMPTQLHLSLETS